MLRNKKYQKISNYYFVTEVTFKLILLAFILAKDLVQIDISKISDYRKSDVYSQYVYFSLFTIFFVVYSSYFFDLFARNL